MNIDFSASYKDAVHVLLKFRERYSKNEYPQKIVLNIFYKQFVMKEIWNSALDNSFVSYYKSDKDLNIAIQKIVVKYNECKNPLLVGNTLGELMEVHKNSFVGNVRYADCINEIAAAQNRNDKAVEELEYKYIYYTVINEAIFYWAGFGRIGKKRIEAIIALTGCSFNDENYNPIFTFEMIQELLTQLMKFHINSLYSPLPSFWN